MYNLERVRNEFYEACSNAGADVCLNMPVELNGRLSRTLGRVFQECDRNGGKYIPIRVEFSKRFIETATDQCIRDVILHEAAHAIVAARTGERHGHDAVFKAVCAEIGTTNDGYETHVESTVADSEPEYKYSIFCPVCNKVVDGRSRRCQVVNHPELYECRLCGQAKLEVIMNW